MVSYPAPVVSDNCPGVTAVCNPPAGSWFPTGVTTVTCTAADTAGNTSTCSFTVTVFDAALQDDSNPSTILLWNSITGSYRFCCKGVTFTGIGKAAIKGCVYTLEHNPSDRRVLGRVDKAVHRGSGSGAARNHPLHDHGSEHSEQHESDLLSVTAQVAERKAEESPKEISIGTFRPSGGSRQAPRRLAGDDLARFAAANGRLPVFRQIEAFIVRLPPLR